MFLSQIDKINKDLKRTKKAIITLGCSFVQGQGALGDDFYNTYDWRKAINNKFTDIQWEFTEEERNRIEADYPDIIVSAGQTPVNFVNFEYKNAFANVLTQKYFQGEYTAINLGVAGRGNRATIKELHYYPSLAWNEIKECVVIYCPTGAERFDFADDQFCRPNGHERWITMWPNQLPEVTTGRAKLWSGYKESLYSDRFEVLEQIAHIQELVLWCAYKNAKLLITPAFQRIYSKQYFSDVLQNDIRREPGGGELLSIETGPVTRDTAYTIGMWPWKNMFHPNGYVSFMDLIVAQEFPDTYKNLWFYEFLHKGTPNLWVTPCCHPNAKAHDLFAKCLYEEITNNLDHYAVKYR